MTTISQAVGNIQRTLEQHRATKGNERKAYTRLLVVQCERLVKVYDEIEEELKGVI